MPAQAAAFLPTSIWRSKLIRSIVVGSAFLIGIVIAGVWLMLSNLRDEQVRRAEHNLEGLALVLSEEISRSIQSIELIQTTIIDAMKSAGVTSERNLAEKMSSVEVHRRLRDQIKGLPHIDAIVILDAKGKLINFSRAWPIPEIHSGMAARAFERYPVLTSFIKKPAWSPANNRWVLPVVRKILGANNEVLGIILGVMDVHYLEEYFKSVARANDRSISLFNADATLAVRYPADESLRGRSFAHRSIFKDILSNAQFGTVRQASFLSNDDLLISGRRLSEYPLSLVVTQSTNNALGGWRYIRSYIVAISFVIALAIAALSFVAVYKIRKNFQAQNHYLDAALNNMSQGLAMFDKRGCLIVCNERYGEMYRLSRDVVQPGITLGDLLRYRVAAGTHTEGEFEDPDSYVATLAAGISRGVPVSFTCELVDGRVIAVTSQPMPGGGWVATHNDITDDKRREASLQLLFERNPVPMWLYDLVTLKFLAVNDAAITHYGYSRDKFLTMSVLDIRPEEDREAVYNFMQGHSGNCDGTGSWRHRKANGEIVDVIIYSRALNYRGQSASIVAIHDITGLKRTEEKLRHTKKFLDLIIENVPVPIMVKNVPNDVIDADGCRYSFVNRACEQLFGIPRSQIIGKTPRDLLPSRQADLAVATNNKILRSDGPIVVPDHNVHTIGNGERVVAAKGLAIRDDDNKPQYLVTVLEDVTDRKRAEQRIAQMALSDALTGLPNRAAFNGAIEEILASATTKDETFAVLIGDLDGFKDANDTYGHSVGDALLREVGRRLQAAADGAFIARIGGDEFALVVTGPDQPACALDAAARLRQALSEEVAVEDRRITVGATFGGAVFPHDGRDARTLMANADIALYRAKAEARGDLLFFDARMGDRVRERLVLQDDLRAAIGRKEMQLYFQPQKRMDGQTIGFEALLRWQCRERGMVPPGSFIPVAEESGLIIPLGEWVLHEACREAATWARPLTVAVNISPLQFRTGDLPSLVHSILLETGLPPVQLELEITEGVLIGDYSRAQAVIRRLKALGVRIALDDFGTGYSSLSYLHSLPFDKIKIDRAFIADLAQSQHSKAIVRAVIDLARALKIPVLAEGVETAEQHTILASSGCAEVQGYFTGRPLPISHYADAVTAAAPWRRALVG